MSSGRPAATADDAWRDEGAAVRPGRRACDRAGFGERRERLVGALEGDVLEIGAGTGLNLPHYRRARRVVALEPDRRYARRLRDRASEASVEVDVVEKAGESLPFGDDSFDHVVTTLALCSVTDLDAVLSEVHRVLRPGGALHFLEHVRGHGRLARWQDRLTPLQRRVADGCHLNRDIAAALERAGLHVDAIEQFAMPPGHPLIKPAIQGAARRAPVPVGCSPMRIEGTGALVVGGASGLGAATARALHERGAQVVVADLDAAARRGARRRARRGRAVRRRRRHGSPTQLQAAVDAARRRRPAGCGSPCSARASGTPSGSRAAAARTAWTPSSGSSRSTSSGRSTRCASRAWRCWPTSRSARTPSAASASTPPRSRRSTARSARSPTRHRRAPSRR